MFPVLVDESLLLKIPIGYPVLDFDLQSGYKP